MMHETPFAACLRSALAEAGMTQNDLAELVGTTPAAVSRYATGLRVPRIETARKIADALGVGLDALCYSERADELADAVLLVCGHVADLSPAQREALMRSIAEYYALLDRGHPRGGRSS